MRYNHESYLPIEAFQPILGRMTLHGGGGGGILSDIVDSVSDFIAPVTDAFNDAVIQPVSDALATADDAVFQPVTAPISQVTSALDDAVIQPITEPISDVGVAIDDAVADTIPGGWGTLAQVAASMTGNPLIIGATSAGVNFARNKDLKSAIEAGIISGGTAGVTQGIGDTYGLGDLGRAGVQAGVSGAVDYAKTGDVNSALKTGAMSGGQSFIGSQLAPYVNPYLNDIKGDFGKYLQEQGVNLSNIASPSNIDPDLGMPGEVSGPQNFYPDAAPALPGELQMTDSGEFINKNPDMQNTDFIPKKIELTPDLRLREDILNQANLDATYTPDSQYINQDAQGYDKVKFKDDPLAYLASRGVEGKDYVINKATGAIDYLSNTNPLDYPGDLYDAAKDYYNESSPGKLALTAAGLYGLSNIAGGGSSSSQGKSQAQIDAEEAAAKKAYSYGTSDPLSPNYLLRNRINAGNVYSNATGYRPLTRYADGGEVQHFAGGGLKGLSDFATRVTQPFEKAILRPIGEAAPFLKDAAPYAGIAAGAMFGNPAMAAGIGGLTSGFGKPGGFDMKRALMGGIAAYGMSNIAGGIEAAGAESLPSSPGSFSDYPDPEAQAGGFYGSTGQTNQLPGASQTFRNPESMQRGIGNLLQGNNPAATSAFTSKAGIYNAGVPLIMGTTGMMGVDESNILKQENDKAAGINQLETDKFNARTAAGRKRAEQAVSQNPYMFAMGGQVNPPDDQTGMPNQTPLQNFEHGGMYNYADGGDVSDPNSYGAYLQSKGYSYRDERNLGDDGVIPGEWGRYGNDYEGGLTWDALTGDNQENAIRGYQYSQQSAPAIAPTPDPTPPAPTPTPVTPTVNFGGSASGPVTSADDLDFMTQMENNRREVDPMSDPRYAGLLKQNQDYLSTIYGDIYNKPPPTEADRAAAVTTAQSQTDALNKQMQDASDRMNAELAKKDAPPALDIETVRANALKALDMNRNVTDAINESTAAVNTAQDLIGTPTTPPPVAPTPPPVVTPPPPPPPVITEPIAPPPPPPPTPSPRATPAGQYLVSNPTSSSPLSSSNIYEYQKKKRGYAEGGLPRFLSGGGDGMSDSIRANIEGSQEARLADGEFVIPADVVSHLGNGSSKAGAKQLYAMMDRVRKARTGNPKQGRQIKPTKLMPV
jgi:hypothetical protein